MTDQGRDDHPLRHCEARSAVAIYAPAQRPMDRFVPRNDGVAVPKAALQKPSSLSPQYCVQTLWPPALHPP